MHISKLLFAFMLLPFVCSAAEIKKINDDWYLGVKKLKVIDEKGNEVEKTHYFSMERVKTKEQKDALKTFVDTQEIVAKELRNRVINSNKYWGAIRSPYSRWRLLTWDNDRQKPEKDVDDEKRLAYLYKNLGTLAIDDPARMIRLCLDDCLKCDSWIVYITEKRPQKPLADRCQTKEGLEEALNSVQMQVSVSTHSKTPFQMHMGIFANPVVVRDQRLRPKNLSMELHGFCAAAMEKHDSSKVYMITLPIQIMREIMQKGLGENCIIGVHCSNLRGWRDNAKSPIVVEQEGGSATRFRLLTKGGKKAIFECEGFHTFYSESYRWFFSKVGIQSSLNEYVTVELEKLAKKF